MAEQAAHNVVNGTQSTGLPEPVDAPDNTPKLNFVGGGKESNEAAEPATSRNGLSAGNNDHSSDDLASQTSMPKDFPVEMLDVRWSLSHVATTAYINQATSSPLQVNGITTDETTQSAAQTEDVDSNRIATVEDPSAQDVAVVDGSYTDTDWRRRDSSDPARPSLMRERSNSIRKPTSFKAVSVTKNFLAKTGTGTTAPPKSGGERGQHGLKKVSW